MTTLTGIKDAQYLAQFLGKKIAIRDAHNPNKYGIYHLSAIFADKVVEVTDQRGDAYFFEWNMCENPYVILSDKEIEIK